MTAARGAPDNHDADEPSAHESFGSVGEEAAKLFEAVSEAIGVRAVRHEAECMPGGAPSTEECRWCPLCRVAHHLPQTRPEVRGHLHSAARSLLAAASALLEPGAEHGPAPAADPSAQASRRRRVEHIDLDEDA